MEDLILCCDWGTSRLRLRLVVAADQTIISETHSDEGVTATHKAWKGQANADRTSFYASVLKKIIDDISHKQRVDLNRVPVVLSGMASSSIGIFETEYTPLPFPVDGTRASIKTLSRIDGISNPLFLISGVQSDRDVMRGEETQTVGLFHLQEQLIPQSQAVILLPGTHSKHIYVENGAITGFRTFMTGELFDVIGKESILRDSISHEPPPPDITQPLREAFLAGVTTSQQVPLLHSLFTVRTNQLLQKMNREQNTFYLSGLLIGSEVNELARAGKAPILISAEGHLAELYKMAVHGTRLGVNVTFLPSSLLQRATVAGQIQIFKQKTIHERS